MSPLRLVDEEFLLERADRIERERRAREWQACCEKFAQVEREENRRLREQLLGPSRRKRRSRRTTDER